jgi:serine/threonine protein kinase
MLGKDKPKTAGSAAGGSGLDDKKNLGSNNDSKKKETIEKPKKVFKGKTSFLCAGKFYFSDQNINLKLGTTFVVDDKFEYIK